MADDTRAGSRRPTLDAIRSELRFLKSFDDVKYFLQKVSYVWPRVTGSVDRWTRVPPSIQIEPTALCNLNCITCSRGKSTRKLSNMDFGLFRKIIDDASCAGVKRVLLFLHGEPLIHPQIVEMIRYIKLKKLAFHLTTNGALLHGTMGAEILRSGVTSADYVTFSILGFSKDVHEKVMMGVKHHQVIENVNRFIELRKRSGLNGPVIETVFYAIPENEHELEPFLQYWRKVADHAIDGGNAVQAFIRRGGAGTPKRRKCALLWERMPVYWNGDVTTCGQDINGECVVGNLRDQTIKEVWCGEALTRIKQLHKEGNLQQLEMCRNCDW